MLGVLEIEENFFFRGRFDAKYVLPLVRTYTRYHICLMRVFILLLSIRYNVCVCHNPVLYHYITATAVYLTQRFARYHICLMRVFIILLSIRYNNVCVCYDPDHRYCCLPHTTFHNYLPASIWFL